MNVLITAPKHYQGAIWINMSFSEINFSVIALELQNNEYFL